MCDRFWKWAATLPISSHCLQQQGVDVCRDRQAEPWLNFYFTYLIFEFGSDSDSKSVLSPHQEALNLKIPLCLLCSKTNTPSLDHVGNDNPKPGTISIRMPMLTFDSNQFILLKWWNEARISSSHIKKKQIQRLMYLASHANTKKSASTSWKQ